MAETGATYTPASPEAEGEAAPATIAAQMDMSSELANQAAAEAAVAAAIQRARPEADAESSSAPLPPGSLPSHTSHASHASVPSHASSPGEQRLPQPGQGPPPPPAYQRASGGRVPAFQFGPPHRQAPDSPLTNAQQLIILREFYARNPNPGRKDLEMLAERTGRPWNKIREYFRQRRNKLRGLADLEGMDEPGRATGWLQVTYRPGPASSSVSQLALYNAYKTRFDPYAASAPLLGGQELIQLACATFPGCEMARDEGDYVLRGLRDKEGAAAESEWDRSVDSLVEPLRSTTWLLSNFQHQPEGSGPSISQTELYSSYAARFIQEASQAADDEEMKDFEANMAQQDGDMREDMDDINSFLPPAPESPQDPQDPQEVPNVSHSTSPVNASQGQEQNGAASTGTPAAGAEGEAKPGARANRLLNPVELIALTRMTFPKAEPAVDDEGRFVIRGLERREGTEKGRPRLGDMFPFALTSAPSPSDPAHPFTALLKRKLALLDPDPSEPAAKKRLAGGGIGVNIPPASEPEPAELGQDERELLDGLQRFRGSRLGKEVRDVCVQQ